MLRGDDVLAAAPLCCLDDAHRLHGVTRVYSHRAACEQRVAHSGVEGGIVARQQLDRPLDVHAAYGLNAQAALRPGRCCAASSMNATYVIESHRNESVRALQKVRCAGDEGVSK